MSHNKQIHKDIYWVPGPVKDVIDLSKILQAAMGIESEEEENSDEDDIPQKYDSFELMPRKRSSQSEYTVGTENDSIESSSGKQKKCSSK